mgnify:CR=1 FL=1
MTAATLDRATGDSVQVMPFGVEADDPRFRDLKLDCIAGGYLRSAISGMKGHVNNKGDDVVPLDQVRHLAGLPRIPGMQLHVNPRDLAWTIIDPLEGDLPLRERLTKWLKEHNQFSGDGTIRGVPKQTGTLDVHLMKSLVREMLQRIRQGEMRVIKGDPPTWEEMERMPGYLLLNPGMPAGLTTQPTYEKDFDNWKANLERMG